MFDSCYYIEIGMWPAFTKGFLSHCNSNKCSYNSTIGMGPGLEPEEGDG